MIRLFINKSLFLLMIPLFLLGCLNTTSPKFEEEMSVYTVLIPDAEHQYIFVYKTYEDIEDLIKAEELFIKDAVVTVESSSQVINYSYFYDESHYNAPSRYIDQEQKVIVKPGEKYILTVKTDIGILTGETIVPNPIKLLTPVDGSTVEYRSVLKISWEKDDTAFGYIIRLEGPPYQRERPDGKIFTRRNLFSFNTTDNSIQISGEYIRYYEGQEYIEDDRRFTIKVMGLDKNLRQHQFDGYPIAGVKNGYGVFGSVVIDSLDIYVVK